MSKAHSGCSVTYAKKAQVRKERELKRALHKKAIEVHLASQGFNSSASLSPGKMSAEKANVSRSSLDKIKRNLIETRPEFS